MALAFNGENTMGQICDDIYQVFAIRFTIYHPVTEGREFLQMTLLVKGNRVRPSEVGILYHLDISYFPSSITRQTSKEDLSKDRAGRKDREYGRACASQCLTILDPTKEKATRAPSRSQRFRLTHHQQ